MVSFNNVSSDFSSALKTVSSDQMINKKELETLKSKATTDDDKKILDQLSKDGSVVNFNVKDKAGSSDEKYSLLITLEDLPADPPATGDAGATPSEPATAVPDKTEVVTDKKGNKIELVFDSTPKDSKKITGDIDTSKKELEKMIPPGKKGEWEKIDKHNINDVKTFLDGIKPPLTTDQKADFTKNYLTAFFNHPGKDIKWGGATLQDGIDAVPTDKNGRKYLDCEAYAAVASELMGKDNMKHYAVDAGGENKIDHQVAVKRNGDKAYVVSNNEVIEIKNAKGKTDQQLIKEAYPSIGKINEDKNGPMKVGAEAYNVGDKMKMKNGGEITITKLNTDNDTFEGTLTKDGKTTKLAGRFEPDGKFTTHVAAGEKLKTGSGDEISVTKVDPKSKTFEGIGTNAKGNKFNVEGTFKDDGSFEVTKATPIKK